jgi:hypothetical protein
MSVVLDVRDVPVLELGEASDATARGAAYGEHFRGVIAEHLEWARDEFAALGVIEGGLVDADVALHAAALAAHAPDAMREQEAVARAANVPLHALLALEHVVAQRRRREDARPDASPDPRGSTLFHTFGPDGAVLALAWDAPEVARFGVLVTWRHREGAPPDDPRGPSREADLGSTAMFGLAGTLGMAAMRTSEGAGRVASAVALHAGAQPAGLGVGGTLRRLVQSRDLADADAWLRSTSRMDAMYWGIADREGYVGVESVHELAVRTHVGVHSSHVHTNHFFDPVLRKREQHPRPGASHRRMEAATTAFAQDRPRSMHAVREWLRRHDRRVRAVSAAAADREVEQPPHATMLVMAPGVFGAQPRDGDPSATQTAPAAAAGARITPAQLHLQRGLLR